MKQKEVLKICEERGHPITPMMLYKAGKKYGFLVDSEDREKYGLWDFDDDKFNAWLDKATEKAPEGWISVAELAEKLNCSLRHAYSLVNDEESGAIRIGLRNVVYVQFERIDKIIEKRLQEHKEKIYGRK